MEERCFLVRSRSAEDQMKARRWQSKIWTGHSVWEAMCTMVLWLGMVSAWWSGLTQWNSAILLSEHVHTFLQFSTVPVWDSYGCVHPWCNHLGYDAVLAWEPILRRNGRFRISRQCWWTFEPSETTTCQPVNNPELFTFWRWRQQAPRNVGKYLPIDTFLPPY